MKAALLVTLVSLSARAELPTVRLDFDRAPQASLCPDEEALRLRVAGRLGYDPFREDAPRVIRLSLTQAGETFLARLSTQEGGTRELSSRSSSCEELAATLELTLALLIDPTGRGAARARAQTQPGVEEGKTERNPPSAEREAQVLPSPPPPPLPEEGPPWEVRASLGGVLMLGAAPGPLWGPEVGLRLAWHPSYSAYWEGLFLLPNRSELSTGRVMSSGAQTELGACLHLSVLGLCAGGNLGLSWYEGEQLASTRRGAALRANLALRLEGAFSPGRSLTARLYLAAHYALVRNTLEVGGQGVWTSPPLGGQAGFSLGRSF